MGDKRVKPSLPALLFAVCFFAGLFFSGPLYAQTRGDYLTAKVAVFGPGTELYFWWGHIALVIEDSASGQSRFFDYGLFSFEKENFFINFARGRLLYFCGVSPAEVNYNHYKRKNRDITVYNLDLDASQKEKITRFAETNVLPGNRDYFYHHFRDNCSTRIRDILDIATDGQFKAAFGEAPGRFTLRQQIRRYMYFSPFIDWFLNFLMGRDIDKPITAWDDMFLPSEVALNIDDFYYIDSSGSGRKLVSKVDVMNISENRPPVLGYPPSAWKWTLIPGMAIALALAFFHVLRKKKPAAGRVLLGIGNVLLGLFFGVSGLILFFMANFTDHDYTRHNANLLFVNPLILAAIPLGIKLAAGKTLTPKKAAKTGGAKSGAKSDAERLLRLLWTIVAIGAFVSMLINLLPSLRQQNQATLALVLPFALILSFFPVWAARFIQNRWFLPHGNG